MIRVRVVKPLEGYRIELRFTDGMRKTVDLEAYLRGPILDELRRDPNLFRQVTVDPVLGTIGWPNGADVDPDVLRGEFRPAWKEPAPSRKS